MSDFEPCRLLLRSRDGVEIFDVPQKGGKEVEKISNRQFLFEGSSTLQHFAPDGSCVYLHQPSKGIIMCPLNGKPKIAPFLADSIGVQMICTSPKGTYILTWERQPSNDASKPNLKVWDAKTGDYIHGFCQSHLRRESWPYLQWTHDEKYAFLNTTNEIRVYDGKLSSKSEEEVRYQDKLKCPGLSTMSVPITGDTSSYLLITFSTKTKDKPARASLHRYPSVCKDKSMPYPAIMSKGLFQAEEIAVHWSPKGDSALVVLQTSVDTSGQSYYGTTTLHLMAETATDVITVPLPNNLNGPVLDVSWMPNPTKPPCFAVISGKMPSMASLHNGVTGDATFLFGNAHRNTLCWAPHGRFLNIAGFGNLAGGMNFWDRNKLKVIPQYDSDTGVPVYHEVVASCTVGFGWSPDSRLFMSSTTSPRMNVDNGVRLYRYNGEEIHDVPWCNDNYKPNKLLQASFVPTLPDIYPDRPQSPAPKISGDAAAIAEAKRLASQAATKPVAAATQRYVPPSARGRSNVGLSLAEKMRLEKEKSMVSATKVIPKTTNAQSSTGKFVPVGLAPSSKSDVKSKSAIRKEKEKIKKAKVEAEEARAKEEAEAKLEAPVDPVKRIKKINKILRQIEELKSKDPSTWDDDQKSKVAIENDLKAELAKLEL
jgi:translation initiation factor 2A